MGYRRSKMAPKGRAADALDNIESMLDCLLDGSARAIPGQLTSIPNLSADHEQHATPADGSEVEAQEVKTSKRPVRKKTKQETAVDSSKPKNESNLQKTVQKRPRKGRAQVRRSSPKHAIRKKKLRGQKKDTSPSKQNRNTASGNASGEPSGLSCEDKDEQQFLQDLKRMAERRRQIEKRRRETRNAQIGKKMKIIMGTAEKSMRELVGSAANDISKAAQSVRSLIPKSLDKKMENLKTMVAEETKSLSDMKGTIPTFSHTLDNNLKGLRAQIQTNEVECDAKLQSMTKAAKKANQKRRDFRQTLMKVEHVLEKDRPTRKGKHL